MWTYVALEASESIATGLLAKIDDAGRRLLEFPMAGPSRERLAAGLRVTFEGNYAIYYAATATEVVIIRVLHRARDTAALADRGGFA
ncbi:type II toxin-antitoxin system RelE/ParE family toxin [Rhodoblastus sp.]|uniref:type II toxin-antitoxin system RelE/ParE family toxin n=1 Tax=Rhodoblastus sp. TaxID=1962975 RepID=UPI003F9A80B9